MKNMNLSAKLFIGAMVTAGVAALASGLMHWESKDVVRFLSVLFVAAVASRLKVKLPGTNGNMSVNLPFILLALAELSFAEGVVIAAVSSFVQTLPFNGNRLKRVQVLFNISMLVVAAAVAELVFHRSAAIPSLTTKSLLVALAAGAFLLADTLPVAAVISLTEDLKVMSVWREMLQLTFAYFLLSAGVAAIAVTSSHYVGWQTSPILLPVMVATYMSYKRYFRMPAAVTVGNLQFASLPAGTREKAEALR